MNSPMTAGVGTWQYSAPEVLCEDKYSQKADVYSYGMVIWETCTRSEPYQGQPPAKVQTQTQSIMLHACKISEAIFIFKTLSAPRDTKLHH